MKALINQPDQVVTEALQGMAMAYPDLIRLHENPHYVLRTDAPKTGKVALVSGGGSGHEPMHAGFVGRGMLDAACPGAIFTSPTPDQIQEASTAVHGGQGILFIVKNYTGDVLNFQMAAELLQNDGIEVHSVVIDDDVAVKDSLYTAGRRGVGATVLAEKICGAAADARANLNAITALCTSINDSARSMGLALSPCTNPETGQASFTLGENEIEYGIGIHGEPGRQRIPWQPADTLTEKLMLPIIEDLPFKKGDEVLLFVNGLGATPLLELNIVYRAAARLASQHGLKVSRRLVGAYMTSLDMAGVSITLLRLDESMRSYWDAPVCTPALRWGC